MTAIAIRGLTKTFPKRSVPALDNLTIDIQKNKVIGLVGPDGAGKTTLLRCIAGLLLPTKGTCTVLGLDTVNEAEKVHEIMGYMPQVFGLYEDLTVIQNLNLYGDLQGVKDKAKAFERLLTFAGLKNFQDRRAGNLSGGMKQKLGLICTLFRKPKMLILDEPTVGVDPLSRRELWKMIEEIKSEDSTVIWSTSYLDEAEKCDHVILLNEGKVLYQGPPKLFTDKLEGRTFHIKNLTNRRETLKQVMQEKSVLDATIQGDAVRVVFREHNQRIEGNLKSVPPRFEDAFIDLLHGYKAHTTLKLKPRETKLGKGDTIIEAKNLTKKFGDFKAVDDISFSIKKGEIFGLLGPNGAGKSTTFKMLCGLLTPTTGNALVAGMTLGRSANSARQLIGYMAQKFSLYKDLTVLQNLQFFARIYSVNKEQRSTIIEEMLGTFGLQPFEHALAQDISLGFKQRLSLAAALMHLPPVLFLDEPTSGVDPITRREFWAEMNDLSENGVTILVSTHFMDEAEFCDRIALIHEGKLKVVDTPEGIKGRVPGNPSLNDAFIYLCEKNE